MDCLVRVPKAERLVCVWQTKTLLYSTHVNSITLIKQPRTIMDYPIRVRVYVANKTLHMCNCSNCIKLIKNNRALTMLQEASKTDYFKGP